MSYGGRQIHGGVVTEENRCYMSLYKYNSSIMVHSWFTFAIMAATMIAFASCFIFDNMNQVDFWSLVAYTIN